MLGGIGYFRDDDDEYECRAAMDGGTTTSRLMPRFPDTVGTCAPGGLGVTTAPSPAPTPDLGGTPGDLVGIPGFSMGSLVGSLIGNPGFGSGSGYTGAGIGATGVVGTGVGTGDPGDGEGATGITGAGGAGGTGVTGYGGSGVGGDSDGSSGSTILKMAPSPGCFFRTLVDCLGSVIHTTIPIQTA